MGCVSSWATPVAHRGRSAGQARCLPTARLLRCWHDQVAGTRSSPRYETMGGLHLRHALHHPLRGASRRGQSARRGAGQGQTNAACQAATGRIPGVSQDPHVLDTVFLGALRMERPFRIPLRRPVTTATRPQRSFSSRRLKVLTYPHIHRSGRPPPPHPHPPFPPPALSGYLDEASAFISSGSFDEAPSRAGGASRSRRGPGCYCHPGPGGGPASRFVPW